jgi:hypothetical protein
MFIKKARCAGFFDELNSIKINSTYWRTYLHSISGIRRW